MRPRIQPHDENDLGTMLDGERMLDEVGIGQVDSVLAAARCWSRGEIRRRRRSVALARWNTQLD